MIVTKYSNYTDAELLQLVDDKQTSPVIQELSIRLSKYLGETEILTDMGRLAECPICEAALTIQADHSDEGYTLKGK